jgi:hypothetical protein
MNKVSLFAVTSSEDNSSARRVEYFADTENEAQEWLVQKAKRLGKPATIEQGRLTVKGENPMAPDTITVYRIEQFTLAQALNYLLGRVR